VRVTRRQLRKLIEAYIASDDPKKTRSARKELTRVAAQSPSIGALASQGPAGVAQASQLYGSSADDPMGELALDLEERYPGTATDPDYGEGYTGIDKALQDLAEEEKQYKADIADHFRRLPKVGSGIKIPQDMKDALPVFRRRRRQIARRKEMLGVKPPVRPARERERVNKAYKYLLDNLFPAER